MLQVAASLVRLCVLASSLTVVCGCGGVWTTDGSDVHVVPSHSPHYTSCSYESVPHNAADVRSDTQFLRLEDVQLTDGNIYATLSVLEAIELIGLSLKSNELTEIPTLTMFHQTLAYLSVSTNQIRSLDLDGFHAFPHIRTLEFSSNPITDLLLTKPVNLMYLYLKETQLTSLDMNLFTFSDQLNVLDLTLNPLKHIVLPDQNDTVNIQNLTLSSIKTLRESVKYQNLNSLKELYLDGNNMETLDFNDYADVPNLQLLNIKSCDTRSISPLHSDFVLPKLGWLDLSDNLFEGPFNLSTFASEFFPALRALSLNRSLVSGVFVDEGYTFNEMDYLNLQNNQIKGSLEINIFSALIFPKLASLYINVNEIEILPMTNMTTTIQKLFLHYNSITEFDLKFFIQVMPRVTTINLSYNLITNIQFPGNGIYHPTLRNLILSGNPLTAISDYCVSSLASLETRFTIFLTDTHLRCDSCLAWLGFCPHVDVVDVVCEAPTRIKGTDLASIHGQLPDILCLNQSANCSLFEKQAVVPAIMLPSATMVTKRGLHECALKTQLLKSNSFSYDEITNMCNIYKDDGGQFTRD